ncbi:AsnC family transcriptional regulator [Candidatus Epulonipiscium fishelsonii]|uniref:AsnC family transcriptional regulator n=1 Tax=Candidatus Epulonipiscium fishelsonii TaxID=77094 RepID=A0ACC8XGA6_9FIRM|nr:AsnC family transcriptional regulator [Epulopiscium sp. SCG-B05WGA-EpuloA1]ONI42557.1 AsnC family transcriptional regulator [Epulopiscium sp. SCG-B11WGA-EpuloA1]
MRNKILELLEENSQYTFEDISIMIGIPIEEVASIVQQLEDEQIICGYKTLINWDEVEDKEVVTALIEVKVTPQRGEGFDKIAKRIYMFKEVTSVYLMSGGFDLTVVVEGKSMKEVALFVGQKLAPLDNVLSTGTHFVLKKYKEHKVIFEKQKKDERMIISP